MCDKNGITKSDEKTEGDIEVERLTEEARLKYLEEHGKWPEEDGLTIVVRI